MSDAAVHLQSEYTFSPRVSGALYLRLCVLSCSSFALWASRLNFPSLNYFVTGMSTFDIFRTTPPFCLLGARVRGQILHSQLGLLQQPAIERWCSN